MPISLTCACGAKLEFDDAFVGKVIPCPDCQRPLNAAPPPPADQRTSTLATISLFLALSLAFTVVGGLVAAALGYLALRQIDRSSGKLAGRGLAKAGIFLGVGLSLVTTGLLFFRSALPLPGFLRTIEWAGKLDYSKDAPVSRNYLSMKRPHAGWGRVKLDNPDALSLDILLKNPFEDALIIGLVYESREEDLNDDTARRRKAFNLIERSDLVQLLLRRPIGKAALPDRDDKDLPNFADNFEEGKEGRGTYHFGRFGNWSTVGIDAVLRGKTYTFLICYRMASDTRLMAFAGAASKQDLPPNQWQDFEENGYDGMRGGLLRDMLGAVHGFTYEEK